MPEGRNGIWKAIALTAMAALQGICFWTLTEIRGDIKNIQTEEQNLGKAAAAQQVQLAAILTRHALEDAKTIKTP